MSYSIETAIWTTGFMMITIAIMSSVIGSPIVIKADYHQKYLETKQELTKMQDIKEAQCDKIAGGFIVVGIFWGIIGFTSFIILSVIAAVTLKDIRERDKTSKENEIKIQTELERLKKKR